MRRTVRIPDQIDAKLEKEAKRLGISSNEATIRAVEHYLSCKKAEETQSLKHIPLKYAGSCIKCHVTVEAGEWAFWGKGVGIICSNCEVQKYGDKGTIRKLLKVKELDWQKQVLTKAINELVAQYGEFTFYDIIQKVHDQNSKLNKLILDYFDKLAMPKEEARFKDVMTATQEMFKLIEEARKFMAQPWLKKKKKVAGLV